MNNLELLNTTQDFAVVGMNDDPKKYANKIFKKLKAKNKTVYGVNRNYETIDNETIYNTVNDIEGTVDIAVMVVNPRIGVTLLEGIKDKGVTTLWLQPGTISDELLAKAETLGLHVVEDCVLRLYYNEENNITQ